MHLVQPSLLIAEAMVPNVATRAYAQVLCEDFARWVGLPVPRIVMADRVPLEDNLCQSPSNEWASVVNTELIVASGLSTALQLQFVIAHALMHLVPNVAEWECDLTALDWMNCLDVPVLESTACAIARTPGLRAQAMQFISGQRTVAIGDALDSHIWDLPVLRVT